MRSIQSLPASGPVVNTFFEMPPSISTVLLAFIGGLLGSACLLFLLMTFPNYLPLTFGGGDHFFLRLLTGGVVAVLVQLVLLTGGSIPGLEGAPDLVQVQAAVNSLQLGVPAKTGLIAVGSGFFSEQIAAAAKGYVDQAFHGGRTAETMDEVASDGGGAMGPGAQAELANR